MNVKIGKENTRFLVPKKMAQEGSFGKGFGTRFLGNWHLCQSCAKMHMLKNKCFLIHFGTSGGKIGTRLAQD